MWSSPFPIDWNIRNFLNETIGGETDYPGSTGTLIVFYSPDQLLSQREIIHSDIYGIESAYRELLKLKESGHYNVQSQLILIEKFKLPPNENAIDPDPLIIALLSQYAAPLLRIYEELEPGYKQRIAERIDASPNPFERWSRLRMDCERMKILLEQHRDQQKRTQQLLSELLQSYPKELPRTDG